jgi:DNA (cytosine-5)-methyltransferase 1
VCSSDLERVKSSFGSLKANKFKFLQEKGLTVSPTVQEALSDLLQQGCGLVDTPDRKGFKSGLYKESASNYQHYVRKNIRGDTIPDSHSFAKQTGRVVARLEYILSVTNGSKDIGKDLKSKLGITTQVLVPLQPNEQAPTVTSHPDDMVHYCEPRILTVRECARLQSFPDDFEFIDKYTTGGKLRKKEVPRYTQIGNAIPPLFGEQAGLILKKMLAYG